MNVVYYRRGHKLKSNGEVVETTVNIAHELNRYAPPAQVRQMLGLSAEPENY